MIHSAEKRAFRTNAGTDVSTQHQTPAQLTQIIAAVSQTGVGGRCQLFSDDVRCCHVLLGHLICSGLLNRASVGRQQIGRQSSWKPVIIGVAARLPSRWTQMREECRPPRQVLC